MGDLKAAAIAANRFGYGAKPGELQTIASDPRGWLKAQLVPDRDGISPGTAQSAGRLALFFKAQREQKNNVEMAALYKTEMHDNFRMDTGIRTLAAAASSNPFRERLAQFWSNHFTVSIQRGDVLPVAAAFEDEAIRPHVLGSFPEMLQAVARHPAMLLYLDNAQSIGPNSQVGLKQGRGLNENLAREMMELHTIGVEGGYSQADVTELAKILTGWSIARDNEPDAGTFRYRPMIHEPGAKTLLGRSFPESGQDEAVAAMNDLALRPATARHLATQLARHFVADNPSAPVVKRLGQIYLDSGGNLHAMAAALIDVPEIWSAPLGKIKTPNDLVISAHRAFGLTDAKFADAALGALRQMGQMPFNAPSPAGWPDKAEAWIAPEAMMTRIDWAVATGHKLAGTVDAREVARATIAPLAGGRTMFQIDNAPSPAEAIALLIASPEFQRR
jgi:uncharacterized protein (DUF1800 family)